jgi:ParB family transcriptional regulator, chromosome partitioning protein
MRGRFGLGRGLDSLIPHGQSGSPGSPGLFEIPVEEVQPNPHQPRHRFDPEELAALAESIREHGVLQPVIVARVANGYVLVAGERRWAAAKQAGLARIPAVVKDATPQQMLELALVENVQRADLNPLEEAAAYRQLMSDFGLTQDEVARRVGRSRSAVANSVRLLGLPESVQEGLAAGQISEGHARALLGTQTSDELLGCYLDVVARGLNVRQTEELVRRWRDVLAPRGPVAAPPEDSEMRRIEELFREALTTRVDLLRRGTGGRLVIHFYDDEQLRALFDQITRPSAS